MFEKEFTEWIKWDSRELLDGIDYPGVYCLAISNSDLLENEFQWIPDICYIGVTNSQKGLRGRLKQFDNTIRGKLGHGGGHRFRYKYPNYEELVKQLFVAIRPFPCNMDRNSPQDLRTMGKVLKMEYDCFAEYVEIFGIHPEFNDKKRSPKDV